MMVTQKSKEWMNGVGVMGIGSEVDEEPDVGEPGKGEAGKRGAES